LLLKNTKNKKKSVSKKINKKKSRKKKTKKRKILVFEAGKKTRGKCARSWADDDWARLKPLWAGTWATPFFFQIFQLFFFFFCSKITSERMVGF
jgi:hypothetical protein